MPCASPGRMQFRRVTADLPAPIGSVDPTDRSADGGDHRRARASSTLAAGLRMP